MLARDCRVSYKDIASIVGIAQNAVKERINRMVSNKIILRFVLRINPALLGYEKECILILRDIHRTVKEQDIINKINLIGDVHVYAKQLGGSLVFVSAVRTGAEDKIGILTDLLKPATLESIFVRYRQLTMEIRDSDWKIMKCLLSDPRMLAKNIAKETSLSIKTIARRLEKMRENHILDFTILTNLSSTQLIGYIEFAVVINTEVLYHQNIIEKLYSELQEYLLIVPDIYQRGVIFAIFSCASIPTVDSILERLESYDGVNKAEVLITTSLMYYQEWLNKEVNKRTKRYG